VRRLPAHRHVALIQALDTALIQALESYSDHTGTSARDPHGPGAPARDSTFEQATLQPDS